MEPKVETLNIINLTEIVGNLQQRDRALVEAIFDIGESEGALIYPKNTEVIESYGPRERVEKQKIIKITNKITYESSLFNELRSRRPFQTRQNIKIDEEIKKTEDCIFCIPAGYSLTSEDTFIESGRIRTNKCFTASNPGKYDSYHGLVIFNEHNPYYFADFSDYLDCSIEWAAKAHQKDSNAINYFFMWNCLWKAGGSIIHGHTQMSLGKGMHYGKIEYLLKTVKTYGNSYFGDLYEAHRILGLGFEVDKVKLMAYLTPIKEKEIFIIAEQIDDVKAIIPRVLDCFYHQLGVRSFNLGLICAPSSIFPDISEEEIKRWEDFPVIIRLLDRGDLTNRTTDFGAMELYAASVVSSDPYDVARELKLAFGLDE
jgi:hypothetical protein